jgi:LmbE family N-acetylglucosaminyl deacetylase
MKIDALLPVPDITACRRILFVQPHPDDNEVGAGATIARLAAAGCEVFFLTATDGSLGTADPAVRPADLAARRAAEIERSAAILGVKRCLSLGLPDGGWLDEESLCRKIAAVIRELEPELVATCDPFLPYEAHPDHRRVGMAVLEACMFSGFPHFRVEASPGCAGDAAPWSVRGVALYTSPAPNTFVRVEGSWERKFEALAAHESQFPAEALAQVRPYFELKATGYAHRSPLLRRGPGRYIVALLSTRKGGARAEAFKVLTTQHIHCFVDTASGDFQAVARGS